MKTTAIPLKHPYVSIFFSTAVVLIGLGLMMLLSVSGAIGLKLFQDPFFLIKKHLLFLIVGIFSALIILPLNCSHLKKSAFFIYVISLTLSVLTIIPGLGHKVGGATRWLLIGGISFQPVEVLKLSLSILWATFLYNKKNKLNHFKSGAAPMILITSPALAILVFQPDFGNTMLICSVLLIVMFLRNIPLRHLLGLASTCIIAALVSIAYKPYLLARVQTFLNPWDDPLGKSYHIIQSFTAIGSGGILGQGIGASKLKYDYLPLFHSDFIYSILAEEGGFILACFTIICYMGFMFSGLGLANLHKGVFCRYLIISVVMFMSLQALLNIGVVLGLFPTTGIPLTFISYGGSSLVCSCLSLGLVGIALKK